MRKDLYNPLLWIVLLMYACVVAMCAATVAFKKSFCNEVAAFVNAR